MTSTSNPVTCHRCGVEIVSPDDCVQVTCQGEYWGRNKDGEPLHSCWLELVCRACVEKEGEDANHSE